MRELNTRYGRLDFPDVDDDVIGRALETFGEWSWLETRFVAAQLAPGARVLDVGAFVGTFALGLDAQTELSWVCAVEANRTVLPAVTRNLRRLLGCDHTVIQGVVAPRGTVTRSGIQHEAGNLGSMSFAPRPRRKQASPPEELQGGDVDTAITLEDLRLRHGPFDLVKLDIEGMEAAVLRDDPVLLSDDAALLWAECNEDPAALELGALMLSTERPLHFVSYPAFNPENHRNASDCLHPLAHEAALLLGPTNPLLPEDLREAGCAVTRLKTVEDLRRALWRTPRWGSTEWVEATRPELVALLGRAVRGEDWATFLMPGGPGPSPHATDERVSRLADTLARTQQFAYQQLATAERETQRAAYAEAEWARMQARLLAILSGDRDKAANRTEEQASS